MFSHSQIAHSLLSAKPHCPHWSQSLSNSIPWQNLASGFAAQQVSPKLWFCGKWQPHYTLSSSSLDAPLFSGKSAAKMVKLLFLPRCCALFCPRCTPSFQNCCHIRDRTLMFPPYLSIHASIFSLVLPVGRARTQRCPSPSSCSRTTPCCPKPPCHCPYMSSNLFQARSVS